MVLHPKIVSFVRTSLRFAAFLYLIDGLVLPSDRVVKQKDTLEQPRLNLQSHERYDLLDKKTNVLLLQGWEVDGEKLVNDNSARYSLSLYDPSVAISRVREINIFFLQTPDHFIEVMAPLTMGSLNIVASASVIDVNPARPDSFMKQIKQEENLVEVKQDAIGAHITIESPKLNFSFKRRDDPLMRSYLKVQAKEIDLAFEALFDGSHESNYWVTPLTDDKFTEFVTWKRAGIPLKPFKYKIAGTEYTCGPRECLLTTDQYRGHHNYGMQFHFALAQGTTSAGDAFGIILQEGIGSKYSALDRASEDHINVNGEVFKLDQADFQVERIEADGKKAFKVAISTRSGDSMHFPENTCKLSFESSLYLKEGINLVLLAHRRDFFYGTYSVDCTVQGGKVIQESAVKGFFEHVWSRH